MTALYQHQVDGAAWLNVRARAYLGDGCGLGKTRTLIAALQRAGVVRPLIVCPAIVRTHWLRELDAMEFAGSPAIFSYDAITRGGVPLMKILVPATDSLVLDESHYLKHASAQRTKMLLGKDGYARRIERVYLASGTPMPRNPAEMYPVLASLFPEKLIVRGIKTYEQFVERYCFVRGSFVRGAWRDKIVGVKPEQLDDLWELLGEIMLRRTLDDVGLDVPRIDWQVTRLDGGAADELLADWMLADDRVEQYAGTLADIATDPHLSRMRRRLGELKAPLVVEMLRSQLDADPQMMVAVFAHHRSVLDVLRTGLRDYGFVYVDGDTTQRERDQALEDFQGGDFDGQGPRVFIGQNIACATGMDGLQHVTNRAVLVEPDWQADVNYQLGHRVARIGATYEGHAIVQMIALAGTLDEAIIAQNARETRMVDAALGRKEAA